MAFLDETGLTRLWGKISSNFVDINTGQDITGTKRFGQLEIKRTSTSDNANMFFVENDNSATSLIRLYNENDANPRFQLSVKAVEGTTSYLGPQLWLNRDGNARIRTTDTNGSNAKDFILNNDGTLTWDGKDIITDGGTQTIGGAKTFTSTTTLDSNYPILILNRNGLSNPSDIRFANIINDEQVNEAVLRLTTGNNLQIGVRGSSETAWYNGPMLLLNKNNTFSLRSGYDSTTYSLTGSATGILSWNGSININTGTTTLSTYDNPFIISNVHTGASANSLVSGLVIRNAGVTKGVFDDTKNSMAYTQILFGDASGNLESPNQYGRLAMIEHSYTVGNTAGSHTCGLSISCYKNITNSTERATIAINYDASGNAYTSAPTPSAVADSSTKIATTAWVRTATGNFACNAATATKVGTATVGSVSKPIYLNAGAPTALSATAGSASKPVWMNAGNITALTATVGGAAKPVYLNAGGITACSATVGTTARPVYLNAGTITVGLTHFTACSATAAGTAGPVTAPAKGKQAQFLRGDATWAAPSTSSDRKVKQDFSSIPDEVLEAWENIKYKQFKLKEEVSEKGNDALYHTGLVVQDIQEVFEQKNLDANKYDMIIHEVWPAHDDEYDEEGNLISPKDDGYEQYFMHYEEALSIEAAYLRKQVKLLKEKVDNLEKQISTINSKIS